MKTILTQLISKHLDAVAASLIACTFIYFYTRHSGIGISPDSVVYQSVAENIRDHFSFVGFNGQPMIDFPLGYPIFLALAMLITGLPVLQVAPLLNGLLFSGTILLASVIINGYQKTSPAYKLLFLAVLACSPCLLEVYSMVWSETLFIFLILLFIVTAGKYTTTHSNAGLINMSIVAALAFVARYAGITLLVTGGCMILFDGDLPTKKKIKHLLLFSSIAISLVLINLIRNSITGNYLTGIREKAIHTPGDNINQASATIADWFPLIGGHATVAVIFFMVIFFTGLATLCYRLLQQQYFRAYETIIACFFVVYIVFILSIASFSRFEDLSSRLLSPLYIPLLLISSSWIIPFIRRSLRIKKYVLLIIAFVLYAGFQYHQYQVNVESWDGIKDSGIPGYSEDSWTQSPTIQFIRQNKKDLTGTLYSNANDAVYYLTGLHALPLPHKEIQQEINTFLQQPAFHLAWFTDGENPDLVSLDFIRQHKKPVTVQEFEGGAVYFFSGNDTLPHH